MENEKKPSRLGVRLSAIVVAVLLVVCMAVPAFAATVDPDEYNKLPFAVDLPDGYTHFVLIRDSDGEFYYLFAFDEVVSGYPQIVDVTNYYDMDFGISHMMCKLSLAGDTTQDWAVKTDATAYWVDYNTKYLFSNVTIYTQSGNVFFEPTLPPPPDPLETVGSGLTVVLDWVGATVSALFSGDLAGLLPLVAIPVAITVLIVAIVVIKRSIWGA